MINEKLIKIRKSKYTQESMAKMLYMTQSQYQRREKGKIKITDEEWERIAKVLETTIEEIKEEDTLNSDDNQSSDDLSNNYIYSIPDFILENQKEYIDLLKQEIQELKEEVKILRSMK